MGTAVSISLDLATGLLGALGQLVLERAPDGRFVRRGALPAWCGRLQNPALTAEAPLPIGSAFPFLEVFLPEAEGAWRSPEPRRVDSELWTEVAADGEELHLEAAALSIGAARLLVVTRNDRIFEQQQLVLQRARELQLAHGALTRELEKKDVLVHCIVHDLTAPLHSILGALSLAIEDPATPTPGPWVRTAFEAACRQRQLIHEILDVFAAERGALDAPPDPLRPMPDLGAVLAQVSAEMAPLARSRRLELRLPDAQRLHHGVVCEAPRLHRVLVNLVRNALQRTPAGGAVEVRAERAGDQVVVSVEDDGPGVPPEVVPHLFEKFGRGPDRSGGTGLGLYFCRITVERWGGALGYQRRAAGGARFWVRLRTAEVADGPLAAGR